MKSVYTVSQVNAYVRNMFTQDFLLQSILVKGEVSNCKYHSSGHLYFTLKDGKGAMACVMFASYRNGLKFYLQEGQQVVVSGAVDVYERDGRYQLYAKEIFLDGAGFLYEQFQRLKRELGEQGLFAQEYKRPIPPYVRCLGVVTAPTGAAIRDIIQIAKRRNPYIRIILYPAIVQGEQAADSIVSGLEALEKTDVDVIIVGRGGGSMEDLWAFNEEKVARAIFNCRVPVISAVGHETDTTIADFVADLRAPTPSAAAELAVFDYRAFQGRLDDLRRSLAQRMDRLLERDRMRLRVNELALSSRSPLRRLRQRREDLAHLEEMLGARMEIRLGEGRHRLSMAEQRLRDLSPAGKLRQGFAYVADEDGHGVTDVRQVSFGDLLTVVVRNGRILARVEQKSEER